MYAFSDKVLNEGKQKKGERYNEIPDTIVPYIKTWSRIPQLHLN